MIHNEIMRGEPCEPSNTTPDERVAILKTYGEIKLITTVGERCTYRIQGTLASYSITGYSDIQNILALYKKVYAMMTRQVLYQEQHR